MLAHAGRPMQRLALAELDGTVVVAVISPMATAVALVGATLSPEPVGVPGDLHRAIAARLRRQDVAALRPLAAPGGPPHTLVPLDRGLTFAEQLGIVRDTATDAPTCWLRAYVDGLRRAWRAIEPVWSRAAPLLDREVERVSVALARGGGAELIVRLLPFSRIDGDALLLPGHAPHGGAVRLGPTLLLQPLIASTDSAGWSGDGDGVCLTIRYPLPAVWRLFGGETPPVAGLDALLGHQRARILHALDRPARAGQLADLLQGPPSMVTHHIAALERAGLVTRERDGRHVWVHRSARGSELAAIYDRAV
jgi:DNA-binding transcriptional ArsR family regulator